MQLLHDLKNKYSYICPKPLGCLEIELDVDSKVQSAIFTDKEQSSIRKLPEHIKVGLDNYFRFRKDIPKSLISKDIAGTIFQKAIWGVILKTDFGQTITYTDMAGRAGRSSAVRAAGTACGKNPLALFIPCHRVVRKKGEDYGYSWGENRKKWLLEFEKSDQI